MSGAIKAGVIVLGIVALLNFGYAVWRTVQGAALESSLPLVVGGVICLGMAVLLGRMPSGDARKSAQED